MGLYPGKPPKTFEEVYEYCKALAGGKTDYGYAMSIYGWFFEELIAKQGELYANNSNGREANATEVAFVENGARTNNDWGRRTL